MDQVPSRKQLRAPSWDYAQPASYMVTICVEGHLPLLGSVRDDKPVLSGAGAANEAMWRNIPSRYPTAALDSYVIMPNHMHGILHLHHELLDIGPYSLGDVMKWFKGATTRLYSIGVTESGWPRYHNRLWQRNYYETIIHSDAMLERLRDYILANPSNWFRDPENIQR